MDMDLDDFPLSWNKALLAIIPGLLATMGLIHSDFSVETLVVLVLLVAFLFIVYWRNNGQIPAWSLMAVGILASVSLTIASGLIGGLAALLVGESANAVVLFVLLGVLVALLRILLRDRRVSSLAWVLFALIIACQLAVRIKYFVLFGVSWSVAGQWLTISLYAAVSTLLLPVVLGWFLAQRYGLATMLFVLGMIFTSFQILIDVNYKVSDQMGTTLGFAAYKTLVPLIFTVIAPLWYMRGQSPHSRSIGVLGLVGLAIILDLVVVGMSYGGDLPPIIWISFIPYTMSILFALILANLLHRDDKNQLTPFHI
jgi:hypothetical protein